MSRRVNVAAAALAAWLLASPDAVEAQDPRLELSGFVGSLSFTQELGSATNIYQTVTGSAGNVDFGKLFGFRAGWAFTRNLAAEASFTTGRNPYRFDVSDPEAGDASLGPQLEADQIFWSGSAIVQFPTRAGLVPYGVVGVGRLEGRPVHPVGDVASVTSTDVSFGGGLKYWVPSLRWLGLRFDVRYHTADQGLTFPGGDASPRGTEITLGGSVRLF